MRFMQVAQRIFCKDQTGARPNRIYLMNYGILAIEIDVVPTKHIIKRERVIDFFSW
jgi:hypothetical protein